MIGCRDKVRDGTGQGGHCPMIAAWAGPISDNLESISIPLLPSHFPDGPSFHHHPTPSIHCCYCIVIARLFRLPRCLFLPSPCYLLSSTLLTLTDPTCNQSRPPFVCRPHIREADQEGYCRLSFQKVHNLSCRCLGSIQPAAAQYQDHPQDNLGHLRRHRRSLRRFSPRKH